MAKNNDKGAETPLTLEQLIPGGTVGFVEGATEEAKAEVITLLSGMATAASDLAAAQSDLATAQSDLAKANDRVTELSAKVDQLSAADASALAEENGDLKKALLEATEELKRLGKTASLGNRFSVTVDDEVYLVKHGLRVQFQNASRFFSAKEISENQELAADLIKKKSGALVKI